MAMIKCPECGKEVSDKALQCPNCGVPIAAQAKDVMIRFPIWQGQLLNNKCYVYAKSDNSVIAEARQGETVTFECEEPIEIYVVVKGSFGKPEVIVKPGDRYNVGYRGFGKIYLEKVDNLSGSASKGGSNISFGIFTEI